MKKLIQFTNMAGEHYRCERIYLVYDHKLGTFRPSTRWENLKRNVRDAWGRVTRVFKLRYTVYHLDCASGIVSVRTERWSWRRWCWEVV